MDGMRDKRKSLIVLPMVEGLNVGRTHWNAAESPDTSSELSLHTISHIGVVAEGGEPLDVKSAPAERLRRRKMTSPSDRMWMLPALSLWISR